MARDRKPLPDDATAEVQDWQLVQDLTQARELAAGREDESAWRELAGRIDRILERMGAVDGGASSRAPAAGVGEDDTGTVALNPDTADLAAASLQALLDRPDEDQLALAVDAVRDLEDSLR